MSNDRDYNKESEDNERKYFYGFDIDVMHPYMIRSFKPFFGNGNLLELGSFKGEFTKRLVPFFADITCVEASNEAVIVAKESLGSSVKIHNELFENVVLPTKYDNIILTHVLEHISDPVALLKKIKDEWLSDKGRLIVVCPNANAPSRQIAVKMGLISHNSAITNGEKEHGHYITYTFDTLERDLKKSKLNITHRSGIFFKPFANFQWDKILQTDIINKEYLDGCYELGQVYPDLCSSLFFVCEK
jgi:2-polyprenyl-3-methyl-5-hydroxy-6-metoxy-1,4-benzoquinol methylase